LADDVVVELDHVARRGAGCFENGLKVCEDLLRLGLEVPLPTRFASASRAT
jgi:hypothetical protein